MGLWGLTAQLTDPAQDASDPMKPLVLILLATVAVYITYRASLKNTEGVQ